MKSEKDTEPKYQQFPEFHFNDDYYVISRMRGSRAREFTEFNKILSSKHRIV